MEEMTPGEIGRSLKRLEDSQAIQTQKLDEIKQQTTKTNGRVDRLEDDVVDLKRHHHRTGTHEQRRVGDSPNAITISIPINRQTIIALLSAAAAIAVMGWKAGLFG